MRIHTLKNRARVALFIKGQLRIADRRERKDDLGAVETILALVEVVKKAGHLPSRDIIENFYEQRELRTEYADYVMEGFASIREEVDTYTLFELEQFRVILPKTTSGAFCKHGAYSLGTCIECEFEYDKVGQYEICPDCNKENRFCNCIPF